TRPAAATSGPAKHPRPASSAPATNLLCRPRSKANRRRLRASLRRCDFGLEGAEAVGGPVGGKGLADDPASRYGSPETAVVARPTVVAHHEVVIGWNGDRFRHIAVAGAAAGVDVGLVGLLDAVDDRVPFADRELVAGAGDDSLDEVLARLFHGRSGARFADLRVDSAFGRVVSARR